MDTVEYRAKTCEEKVQGEMLDRVADIRKLWDLACSGDEEGDEELGTLNEYGLCFDYVAPEPFGGDDGEEEEGEEGYFRYQLSWGGPSDEFRFFCDGGLEPYRIEYWFLDWFDGASVILHDEDRDLLMQIFYDFEGMGMVQSEFENASEY